MLVKKFRANFKWPHILSVYKGRVDLVMKPQIFSKYQVGIYSKLGKVAFLANLSITKVSGSIFWI